MEALAPAAIKALADALNSADEKIRLEAAKEVVKRTAPAAPRPAPNVSVAISTGGGVQEALATLALKRLARMGRITPAELAAAMPAAAALPAPAIDVDAVEVAEPADEPDELDRAAAEIDEDE
jgi:hypothetical protein